MGWTYRVVQIGSEDIEGVARRLRKKLLVDPKTAALIFDQLADEIIYCISEGIAVDMGVLGFMRPAIRDQGWAKEEGDMTLHNTKGSMKWTPGKKTKAALYGIGCTPDWCQRTRDRQRYKQNSKNKSHAADDDFDDDDYPLDIE